MRSCSRAYRWRLLLNVDETGHKDNGDRFWTWVFKAELYVLFRIDKSRGSQVLIEVLGKEFDGTLGCDYFSAYHKFMKDFHVAVQFCIAHLIRDIKLLTTLPDAPTVKSCSTPSRGYSRSSIGTISSPRTISAPHSSRPRRRLSTSASTAMLPRAPEAPKASAPTNGYGPLSPPALYRGARPSSSFSRPCRPISTIAIRPLYSPTLLEKLPKLEGATPAPSANRAPLPSVATDAPPEMLTILWISVASCIPVNGYGVGNSQAKGRGIEQKEFSLARAPRGAGLREVTAHEGGSRFGFR